MTTWIAGRRYRLDIAYLLAKDALENDRLNFQHHLLRAILGDYFAAPLTNQKAIFYGWQPNVWHPVGWRVPPRKVATRGGTSTSTNIITINVIRNDLA